VKRWRPFCNHRGCAPIDRRYPTTANRAASNQRPLLLSLTQSVPDTLQAFAGGMMLNAATIGLERGLFVAVERLCGVSMKVYTISDPQQKREGVKKLESLVARKPQRRLSA
jgi:hypothetical protein